MIQETRIIFELTDLERFQITCNRCNQTAAFPVDSDYCPNRKCLHCGEFFELDSWELFKEVLPRIRKLIRSKDTGIGLHFEIKGNHKGEG